MKIVTDSAADLTPEDKKTFDFLIAPLQINFPEKSVSAEEITPDHFYDRLKSMFPQIPTTSQPSSGLFREIYQQCAAEGQEILSVHISSGLSGTLDAARQGVEQAGIAKVTLWDSLTLSGGQRYQVLAAAMAARAGWGMKSILEQLEKVRTATETIYTLETLDYLARGGRIGRVQALAGSLLHIKPIIHVDKQDGKYNQAGRGRTIGKALDNLVDFLARSYDQTVPLWATVLHGQFAEGAEKLAGMLEEKLNIGKLEITRISPVLGVHTGPGIVGAAVVPLSLFEEIESEK